MKKGDKVKVNAEVQTSYYNLPGWELIHKPTSSWPKSLYRYKRAIEGIVLGYTFLSTGNGRQGIGDYDPSYLIPNKRFKVWAVESVLSSSNRYYKPIRCLEEDLEIILPIEGTFDSGNWKVRDLNKMIGLDLNE